MRNNVSELGELKRQMQFADDASVERIADAIRGNLAQRDRIADDIVRAVLSGLASSQNPADAAIVALLQGQRSTSRG